MTPAQLIHFLAVAEKLKCTTRHCYTSSGRHESVAEHSWRIALMAEALRHEFPDTDIDKVIRMCLIHDLGEAFTGDIPTFEKSDAQTRQEEALLHDWIASLPEGTRQDFTALLTEMEQLQTKEARLYKALDKLEAVIQHNESDISTWLPLEYELQLSYGKDAVEFSPYLQALRAHINDITRQKIADENPQKQPPTG